MPEPEDKLRYAMEDEAWGHYSYADKELYLASAAVSLKRIADVLTAPQPSPANEDAAFRRLLATGTVSPRIGQRFTAPGPLQQETVVEYVVRVAIAFEEWANANFTAPAEEASDGQR